MGEEDGDRLFRGVAGEGAGDVVAPELVAHCAHGGGGGRVGDSGDFQVEGAEGEIRCLGVRRDEGEESVGGGVVFSGSWSAVVGGIYKDKEYWRRPEQ